MGDHRDAVHPQEECAAELPPVGPAPNGPQPGADEQATQGGERVTLHRIAHTLEDKLRRALCSLDQDIAAEAVGDNDIGLSSKDVLTFDIADEADARVLPKAGLRRLDQLVTLAGFLTVAEQGHARLRDAHQLFGTDSAHYRVLHKVLGLRIGVGADVEEKAVPPTRHRNDGTDRRPVDAGYAAEAEERGSHHGPAVAGADESADPPVLDHLDAANDR